MYQILIIEAIETGNVALRVHSSTLILLILLLLLLSLLLLRKTYYNRSWVFLSYEEIHQVLGKQRGTYQSKYEA